MRKILVTGFDPFGGESINPAYEAVKLLPEQILDARVIPLEVPTVFDSGPKKVIEAVSELQPDFVLCIGQAGGRSQITPEFVGINYAQARIPDNEGNQPLNVPLVPGAPAAYFTQLPVYAMVEKIKAKGASCRCVLHGRHLCVQRDDVQRAACAEHGIPAYPRRLHACALCDGADGESACWNAGDEPAGYRRRHRGRHRGDPGE